MQSTRHFYSSYKYKISGYNLILFVYFYENSCTYLINAQIVIENILVEEKIYTNAMQIKISF